MANGYIGKISAVVTANTSDLSRKLSGAVGDVDKFANSINASLARLEKSGAESLNKLFTPLQNLERKFATALKFNIRTEGEVAKLRQLVSVAEQVNKPLSSATNAFGRLSAEVQSAFFPALRRAQNETVRLNIELDKSGKVSAESFTRAERAVDNLTQAQRRLLQVQELTSQGFTGRELQFSNSRVFGALQAASQASQRAALLPAGEIEGEGIARRVQSLQRLRDQIARQFARVSEIRLRPNVDASLLAGAERRLDQLIARTEEASRRLDAISSKAARGKGLNLALTGRAQDLQQAEAAYGRILASVQSLDAAQRKAFRPNLRALGRLIDSGDEAKLKEVRALISAIQRDLSKQGKVSLEVGDARKRLADLRSEVQSLDAAQRKAFGANLRRLASLVRTDDAKNLAEIRKLLRDISTDLAKQLKINLRTEEAKKKVDEIKARLRGVAETLSGRQSDPFERLAVAAEKAKRAVDGLADSRRKASLQARIGSIESSVAAAGAPGSGLSAAQLAAAARARARQLEGIAVTAGAQRGTATDVFGPIIGSSRQRLDELKSQILSLQSSLASLPRPLQSSLIPQLRAVRDIFAKLTPTSTAAEIRAAARAAGELEKNLKRASASAQFRGTFGQFLRDGAVERYASQLKSVQGQLAAVGVTARGPVADAVNQYQRALERAATSGTLGTERVRQRLDKYIERIAAAAVATGKLTEAQAKAFAANARSAGLRGDVGRFGVDRLSLGLQQAAFAVDDFFSVTGGFEQRIRAVGNNLTQLGFIVGGTTGLFVALGVSLGAQAIAGIVRFINSGQAAEDQTKAINDALERQKTLADQLAESFSNLANAIATRGFSEAAKQARDFARDLESLIKLQRDAREERLVSANPRGREIDNRINSLNRRLRDTTDPGQAAAIQDQIGSLQEERRRLRQTLPGRPTPTRDEVANSIGFRGFQSNAALAQGVFLDTIGFVPSLLDALSPSQNTRARIGADSARAAGLIDPNNTAALRAAVDARIQEINPLANQDIGFVSTVGGQTRNILAAREERTRLVELQRRFEDSSFDDALRQYVESVNSAGVGLEAAQNEVTRAIEAGVPGARSLGVIIDSLSQQIDNANTAIRKAIDEFNANPTAPGAAERRDAVIAEQQGIVNRTRAQRAAVEAESDRLRRERTLNPERQFDAVLSRTQATIDRIGDPAGALRTRLRELQFQRDTVQQQLQAAPADPVLIRAEENLTASIRSLEAEVNALDETLNGFEAREARRLTGDAERGRELSLTPGERAAEQVQQGINDIITRFGEVAAETTGLVDEAGRQDAIGRFINDQLRQFAPAVFALADEVTNAVLQGPSRAALGATDASTIEGQRELNRLLRGDDSARDVNLLELQKQTQVLEEIKEKIAEPPPVAP